MAKEHTIRLYDGDDNYSWAVFKTEDVKGLGNQIFYGDATPLMCSLSRIVAAHERDNFEREMLERQNYEM